MVAAIRRGIKCGGPSGYANGTPITSTSTWAHQILAGLGLTAGNFVFD